MLESNDPAKALRRITAAESNETTAPVTEREVENGRHVGSAIKLSCFICRRYFSKEGTRHLQGKAWWCRVFHMPLCKENRTGDDGGRNMTCIQEHLHSTEEPLMYIGVHRRGMQMPEEFFVGLHQR